MGFHGRFVKIGVEELDWPAQSPDLKYIEHRLQARPDLTNALVAEWNEVPEQCSNI
jgi:hypothetical protein